MTLAEVGGRYAALALIFYGAQFRIGVLERLDFIPLVSVTCLLAIFTRRLKGATSEAPFVHNQGVVRQNGYTRTFCFEQSSAFWKTHRLAE